MDEQIRPRIAFIDVPDGFNRVIDGFEVEPEIALPIELPESGDLETEDITWEAILSGMLMLLADEPLHEHGEYYRSFVQAVRPNIKSELTEAGIFKARNRDFTLARELFGALSGLFPSDPSVALNVALVLEDEARYRLQSLESTENIEGMSVPPEEDDSEDVRRLFNEADLAYRRALDIDEAPVRGYFDYGHFLFERKLYHDASKHLTAFVSRARIFLAEGGDELDDVMASGVGNGRHDPGETDQDGADSEERSVREELEERINEAEALIEAIETDGLSDEQFTEAYALIRSGKVEEGIDRARTYLEQHETAWNGWFLLGWGLRKAGRFESARDAFLMAISHGGTGSDVYNEAAICALELGDLEQSQELLLKAYQADSENTKIISNLGVLAMKLGRPEEAVRFFRAVQEMDPNDPIAARFLRELE